MRYGKLSSIEADAVVGALTDSDFIGGGTGGFSHEVNFSVGITSNIAFDATCFLNESGIDSDVICHRVQADVIFKL